MALKKKYLGGLKVFLLLLFTMLLGSFSTSYALTPSNQINTDYLNALYTKINEVLGYYNDSASLRNRFNAFLTNSNIENIVASWNNNINLEYFPTFEQLTIVPVSNSSTTIKLILLQNNNTIGENLPFIGFNNYNNSTSYESYYMQTGTTFTLGYIQDVILNSNGTLTFGTITQKNVTPQNYGTLVSGTGRNARITKINDSFANIPHYISYGYQTFSISENKFQTANWYYNTNKINYEFPIPEEPEEPSGDNSSGESNLGNITTPSGDSGGNINLQPIEDSLNRIEDKIPTSGEIQGVISGEVEKITNTLTEVPDISGETISSGDIENALNFDFVTDRYANFWFELTQGLKNAFLGSKRSIDITFQNHTYTISLDNNFAILPSWLQVILTPLSTCFIVWLLVRWWKLIIDKITSGDVDSLLKENQEEGISNLF